MQNLNTMVGSIVANSKPMMLPEIPIITPPNMAEYAVEAIYAEIAKFESSLSPEMELGMPVVGGPSGLSIHVRQVHRYGTDKLVFSGVDASSNPVRLVQHLSQLNFLMIAVPKLDCEAVRIGFHQPKAD